MSYRRVGTNKWVPIGKMGRCLKKSRDNGAISDVWNEKQIIVRVIKKAPLDFLFYILLHEIHF